MKKLYLLRHAKAGWSSGDSSDRARPLEPRGEEDAARVGRLLHDMNQIPDLVVSSPAVRAEQTARRAIESGEWDREPVIVDHLYGASSGTVLQEIRRQDDDHESLLIAFHQPTCAETLSNLVGHVYAKMPTAALARIDLQVGGWADVEPGSGILAWLVTPKILRSR
jgi:phosphohistidine phosphatase